MACGVLKASIQETPVAVVDLETTGLNAGTDRIIEIAIFRKMPGQPFSPAFETLVNPHRRVAATEIHGITDDDVRNAPDFETIAGEVARAFTGCVVAAYNVYFDMRFLADEFSRVGIRHDLPHLCLMYLRPMLGIGPRRSLKDACDEHGIQHDSLHIASADALVCSRLMDLYLNALKEKRVNTFADLAELKDYKFLESLQYLPLSPSEVKRPKTTVPVKPRGPVVKRPDPASTSAEAERQKIGTYWDALTSALADLEIGEGEFQLLQRKKNELGLQVQQVRMLHARAFAAAISQFTDDQWLDDDERRRLSRLHNCLHLLGWAPGL